ncbi:hypothetical protein LTR66_003268 [Elasticomyces elasticus]|nr:hypothetical protein LTR66_003268 [Elasticomyces elasticus]
MTGDEDPKFTMLLTLRYRKGYNIVDPVKILIAYAIRTGDLPETNWTTLLYNVSHRKSKALIWSDPNQPVFRAYIPNKGGIDFSKPAGVHQQRYALREASDLVGMMQRPWSHDLRRGAAQDLSHLSVKIPGLALDNARDALGHTYKAITDGITEDYRGRRMADLWGARWNSDIAKPVDNFGVEFAEEPFKRPRIVSAQTNRRCNELGLDPAKPSHRMKAQKDLHKELYEQWATEQRRKLNTVQEQQDDGHSVRSRSATLSTSNVARKRPFSVYRDPDQEGELAEATQEHHAPMALQDITSQSCTRPAQSPSSPALPEHAALPHPIDEELIDPVLRHFCPSQEVSDIALHEAQDIGFTGVSPHQGNEHQEPQYGDDLAFDVLSQALGYAGTGGNLPTEAVTDMVLSAVETIDRYEQMTNPVLVSNIGTFIDFFSKINTVALQSDSRGLPDTAASGNSRDPPARFLYACKYNGCDRNDLTVVRRQIHQQNCPFNAELGLPQVKKKERSQPDALAVYPGFPQQCPDRDTCQIDRFFDKPTGLQAHRRAYHSEWPGNHCGIKDCPFEAWFIGRTQYSAHLRNAHRLPPTEVRAALDKVQEARVQAPSGTSTAFTPSVCLHPDCANVIGRPPFEIYHHYSVHLRNVHQVYAVDQAKYMPTAATAQGYKPVAVLNDDDLDLEGPVKRKYREEGEYCRHQTCLSLSVFTFFKTRAQYHKHLDKIHNVKREDAPYYMSGNIDVPFHSAPCQVPDCKSTKPFSTIKLYDGHLLRSHKHIAAEDRPKYRLWWVRKFGCPGGTGT